MVIREKLRIKKRRTALHFNLFNHKKNALKMAKNVFNKTGFKNGKRVNDDGTITYINNINRFKSIIEESLESVKEQGAKLDEGFQEAINILEKHTKKKITTFKEFTDEIQKIKSYEDINNLTIGELFNDIKNLPPIIREALKTFPMSGHLIDAKLKTTKSEINEIIPRIELSQFEDRVVNSLIKSLYLKSDKDKKSETYYLGNGEIRIAKNGNLIAQLIIKPQELYKEITGKKRPNGKDIKEIREALNNLSSKKYPIEYRKKIDKEFIVEKNSQPLLSFSSLARFNEKENSKYVKGNNDVFTKKEDFIISFNPIFIDQIKTKFVLFPTDLEDKISLASPKRVKTATNNLRDYLLRGFSNKKYSQQIYKNKLEDVLNISHQRKARREALLNEALEVCVKVELLENYSITTTSKGEKFIFKLNPNFVK